MSVVDFKTQEWHILVNPSTEIPENSLVLGDCMDLLQFVPDKSQNMILADLPYGTTNCKWDEVLPMHDHYYFNGAVIGLDNATKKQLNEMRDPSKFIRHGLWTHYKRILKPGGVILLYAQTPFDKVLGASNLKMLKYEWIWEKTQATGHFNAKKMPMKAHENILVFYDKLPTYNPQKTEGHDPVNSYTKRAEVVNKTNIYGKVTKDVSGGGETDRYPRSVLQFPPPMVFLQFAPWHIISKCPARNIQIKSPFTVLTTLIFHSIFKSFHHNIKWLLVLLYPYETPTKLYTRQYF